jgi:adenosine/AMP kinase
MADDPLHPVQPKLEQLEGRLETTLQEVRDEISISDAETSELIRTEEALDYANEVAKQAISLRRRIDADHESPPLA